MKKKKVSLADSFKAFFVDTLDKKDRDIAERTGHITSNRGRGEDVKLQNPTAYGDAIADADGRNE